MADPARDLGRVLELLWEQAEGGSVSAQRALYDHYRRDDAADEPEDEWSAIYGDDSSNVTPLRRREAT